MYEGIFNYFVLWFLWHVLLWPWWYNDFSGVFNNDKDKTFCSAFAVIYNSYILLYMYYVSERSYDGEHVVVLSSVQFFVVNLGGNCLNVFPLMFT